MVQLTRDQALELPREQIFSGYGLEVNFLLFNLNDRLLKDKRVRGAIRSTLDPERIQEIGNGFVRPVSQFVAPGVFGYNPEIPLFEYKEENRVENFFGKRLEKIELTYVSSYETLAEYIKKQLKEAGFSVSLKPLEPEDFLETVEKEVPQLILIGWQAEDGDAGGFLDTFIHSKGHLNPGRYENKEVDQMIEEEKQEMDNKKRLSILQAIMVKVNEDFIGIPLFESSRIYAVQPEIEWHPRLDGLVLASEVK